MSWTHRHLLFSILALILLGCPSTAGGSPATDATGARPREEAVSWPDWLKESRWKGDFRYRYQVEDLDGATARLRQRLRLRYEMSAPVHERVQFAARVVTGGTANRSANATLENAFAHFVLALDKAWIRWQATPDLQLQAGSFSLPQVVRGDHLFDSDLCPGGISLKLEKHPRPDLRFSFTGGIYPVDESAADGQDPMMVLGQMGFHARPYPRLEAECYLDLNHFRNFRGKDLPGSPHANSYRNLDDNGDGIVDRRQLIHGFNSLNTVAGLYYATGHPGLPWLGLIGNYLDNRQVDDEDRGWLLALALGEKNRKVRKPGQWSLYFKRSLLQRDAWPDIFPDADVYGGSTGVKSDEVNVDYCLARGVAVSVDAYRNRRLVPGQPKQKNLQIDFNFLF